MAGLAVVALDAVDTTIVARASHLDALRPRCACWRRWSARLSLGFPRRDGALLLTSDAGTARARVGTRDSIVAAAGAGNGTNCACRAVFDAVLIAGSLWRVVLIGLDWDEGIHILGACQSAAISVEGWV